MTGVVISPPVTIAGMSGPYERELRSVLAGEKKGVIAITRSCNEVERARAMQVCERPFLVVRAPGSGSEGTGDLLVLRGDVCFPIEVKSSKVSKICEILIFNFEKV